MNLLIGLSGLLCILLFHAVDSLRPPDYRVDIDSGSQGSYPEQKFVSSKLRAPYANFLQWHEECDDGLYYFLTPRGWKVEHPGPMILDGAGTMIWSKHFDNNFGGQAYDFKVQSYKGENYLTFWLGDDTIRGHGTGHYYMLNSSYDIVHEVGAANGLYADLHDFIITPEGTALLVIFQPVKADVRPLGRKFNDLWNQYIWDCVFQEVDIETGRLLFEWRASEHLDLIQSYEKLASLRGPSGTITSPFDFFHINSIDKDELGNYLVSARNLHSILYIDGKTKKILWMLGGKKNDFGDLSSGHVLNFAWQHDARFVSPDAFPEIYTPPPQRNGLTTRLMTVFDNAAMDWKYLYGPPYSRVLLLELTYPTHDDSGRETVGTGTGVPQTFVTSGPYATKWQEPLSQQDLEKVMAINGTKPLYTVRTVHEYVNPKRVISSTQGSAQLLNQGVKGKDPHVLVGYGINGVVTEFSSNGSVLCDLHFGSVKSWEKGDIQSYRAFKFPWVGRPEEKPAIAVRRGNVYASWNGATDVVEWTLTSAENVDSSWKDIARVPKQGFETAIPLNLPPQDISTGRHFRVAAVCGNGQACKNGFSEVIYIGRSSLLFTTGGIRNVLFAFGNSTLLIICFILVVASSLCMGRVYRSILRRRRYGRPDGVMSLRQRRID